MESLEVEVVGERLCEGIRKAQGQGLVVFQFVFRMKESEEKESVIMKK